MCRGLTFRSKIRYLLMSYNHVYVPDIFHLLLMNVDVYWHDLVGR